MDDDNATSPVLPSDAYTPIGARIDDVSATTGTSSPFLIDTLAPPGFPANVQPEPVIVDRLAVVTTLLMDQPRGVGEATALDLTADGCTLMFAAAKFGVDEPSLPCSPTLPASTTVPGTHPRVRRSLRATTQQGVMEP